MKKSFDVTLNNHFSLTLLVHFYHVSTVYSALLGSFLRQVHLRSAVLVPGARPPLPRLDSGRPVQQTPNPPNHNWQRHISLTRNRDHRNPSQACFGFLEPLTAEHGHSDSAHHGDAVPRLQTRLRLAVR
jgi:hypothetical protein